MFVGLDWGGSSHAVCVVDTAGKTLEHFAVANDRDGLAELVARLRRQSPARRDADRHRAAQWTSR
ncbi:IS110 family transposase [Mesorhizobium sp. M1A.F.Ca.ET.072.01.1.1]|uniref:IS110 family transposase n=1 Tax=Mesorhizobium sp. M1A.F.Ca.ET.072.01.1.1 TaxID=2496753 RepID=UPI001FDF269F|nr:IS110 family transposase [Mesorhizobium sp. M1A.F.Ca.ET.072.01.1.1]